MNKLRYILLLCVLAISLGVVGEQFVEAQTIEISDNISLDSTQVIYVVIIGSVAGVIRAWQGYDKSPNDFDTIHFITGVRDSVLISIPAAFATALTLPELNATMYVLLFFTIIGGTTFIHSARLKSIPSNATEEEIEEILRERG